MSLLVGVGCGADRDEAPSTAEWPTGQTGDPEPESPLNRYVAVADPFHVPAAGADNLSSATWNPDTRTYFVLVDAPGVVLEFDAEMSNRLREIEIVAGSNYEGIVYLGHAEFALVNESNELLIDTIDSDDTEFGNDAQVLVLSEPPLFNLGAEGVAYAPDLDPHGRFWVVQEKSPLRIFQFDRPADDEDHGYDGDLAVSEPWSPEFVLAVDDLSDVVFDPRTGRLLLLSHESNVVLDVDPATGDVHGELALPISIAGFPSQWEAIALGPSGRLAVGSEAAGDAYNRMQFYEYE